MGQILRANQGEIVVDGFYYTPTHENIRARDWMMGAEPDLKVIDLACLGLK